MKITKKEIYKNIYLLTFENQLEITSTLLRFQEHYESPKFRNKIFTLEEYKKWYIKETGDFSYYTDWNGFNFPSSNLKPFLTDKFDPLSKKEKEIIKLFKDKQKKYYIIGVHKAHQSSEKLLRHELAHALYYLDDAYKKEVLKILKTKNLEKMKDKLRKSGGYCEEVLDDEVQAYLQNYFNKYSKYNFVLAFKLRRLYNKHCKKYCSK